LENLDLDEIPTTILPDALSSLSLLSNGAGKSNIHALYILEKAFGRMKAVGSSTALLAIKNNNQLNVCNLGDSGI